MLPHGDSYSLEQLRLRSGEGRRVELAVSVAQLHYGGADYRVTPRPLPVVLDVSRTTQSGYALRLRFGVTLEGPCMRCLDAARPEVEVDVREVSIPGAGEELASPYVHDDTELDVRGWANDALVLAVPDQILCRADCRGLCPECGENLNAAASAGREHVHERDPDPRWAKLSELKFD